MTVSASVLVVVPALTPFVRQQGLVHGGDEPTEKQQVLPPVRWPLRFGQEGEETDDR